MRNSFHTPGFEFPLGSQTDYLYTLDLWIGGVIDNDTLVSATYTYDITDGVLTHYGKEFYPPNDPVSFRSIMPMYIGEGRGYRTFYVDTFTADVLDLNRDYWGNRPHQPLYISVVQKSYSYDVNPYRNILLLDFIVTNIGTDTIHHAYVGVYVDADACAEGDTSGRCYYDDLTGSFRDIHTAYLIDNDGNPQSGLFLDSLCVLDGIACRPVAVYPPVTDTAYNWWLWSYTYQTDFGPRLKGTPEDPFRDFGTGGIGTPCGDVNKYYLLRHKEWDYDQLAIPTIAATDTAWLPPDTSWEYAAHGEDARFLLSVGPLELPPGKSARSLFAIFGADLVHVDPDNQANLFEGNYQRFYDNLQFDILRQTAEDARAFADEMLDPTRPPTGLEIVRSTDDSVLIRWDPYVFPEVIGYNLYLAPVPDSLLIGPEVVLPITVPLAVEGAPTFIPADSSRYLITGLEPGQLYFAALTHVTSTGEGELSVPLTVGYGNHENAPHMKDFTFYRDGDSIATLTWTAPPNTDVEYYRIYKTTDTSVIADRYYPFLTSDTAAIPFAPKRCREFNGEIYCYYEIEAYDSTSSDITTYRDTTITEGAFYWVAAVDKSGYPSRFSNITTLEKTIEPSRDILVILGTIPTSQNDYVVHDSLLDFYRRLLDGYDYDLYHWFDTNNISHCTLDVCTDWYDLANYRLIIVEEFPSPQILTTDLETSHKLFTKVLNSGREFVYFGTLPNGYKLYPPSNIDTISYGSESFERRYLAIEQTLLKSWGNNYATIGAIDSLAGFNGAVPVFDSLPFLPLDTVNNRLKSMIQQLFNIEGYLPLTGVFSPSVEAQVLYTYASLFPSSSEFQGKPCGLLCERNGVPAYTFSFHLWAIEETAARQLIDYIIAHRPTGVPSDSSLLPRSALLYQNYPNPFNNGTRLSFELPRACQVTLEIYNILGQKVAALLDKKLPAGKHTVFWNGTDASGKSVASGVYFYRLQAGEKRLSKKMMLLK